MDIIQYMTRIIKLSLEGKLDLDHIDLLDFKRFKVPETSDLNQIFQTHEQYLFVYSLIESIPNVSDKEARMLYLPLLIKHLDKKCSGFNNQDEKKGKILKLKLFYTCYYSYQLQLNNQFIEAEANYQSTLNTLKGDDELKVLLVCVLNNLILVYKSMGNDYLGNLFVKRLQKFLCFCQGLDLSTFLL